MRDTAAVIGAAGFLGSALCAGLREAGVAVCEFTRARPFVVDGGDPHPDLAGARTVYFLASSMSPASAARRPEVASGDIDCFRGCIDALRRAGSRPRVVLASSGGRVYDLRLPPPYTEGSPLRATDRYGQAKLELERRLARAGEVCRPIVLRISNAYGPGQQVRNGHGVVAHWFDAVMRREPITIYGNPATIRDYVYVDDVVAAFLAMHVHPDPPEVLNIGSGTPSSLATLADLVRSAAGDVPVRAEPAREFDAERTWLDVSLARGSVGWAPTVSLDEGIRRTWRHVRREDDGS